MGKDADRDRFLDDFPDAGSRIETYRAVYRCFTATGDQRCCSHTEHSFTWVKNMKHPDCANRPRRAPQAFGSLLQMFGSEHPAFPQPVPSILHPYTEKCTRPECRRENKHCCGHYMRLPERMKTNDAVRASGGNEPDRHYPDGRKGLFMKLDEQIDLLKKYKAALAAGDKLPADLMGHMEDAFKTPAEDIIYVLNVQLTKLNHRDTMKAFTIMNACSGVTTCIDGAASVDDAVTAFVQRHRTRKTKPTASGAQEAVTMPDLKAVLGMLKANDEGLKPELVRKVFMAAQLGKAAEERTVRMAVPVSVCSP